jgi:hypothetical protein
MIDTVREAFLISFVQLIGQGLAALVIAYGGARLAIRHERRRNAA